VLIQAPRNAPAEFWLRRRNWLNKVWVRRLCGVCVKKNLSFPRRRESPCQKNLSANGRELARRRQGKKKSPQTKTFAHCSLRFSGTVPPVIWHDFRKFWFWKKKAGKYLV
jgi:hypothetical protein